MRTRIRMSILFLALIGMALSVGCGRIEREIQESRSTSGPVSEPEADPAPSEPTPPPASEDAGSAGDESDAGDPSDGADNTTDPAEEPPGAPAYEELDDDFDMGCTLDGSSGCEIDCRDHRTWPAEWRLFERRVIELANEHRAAGAVCGTTPWDPVPPLEFHPALAEAARCHSVDQVTSSFLGHIGSDGSTAAERIAAAGYPWRNGGENARRHGLTPEGVLEGWMKSPGHCVVIMGWWSTEIGVGVFSENPDQHLNAVTLNSGRGEAGGPPY